MKYRDIDLHDGTIYIAPVKEGLMEPPISNADSAVNKLADYIERQQSSLRKLLLVIEASKRDDQYGMSVRDIIIAIKSISEGDVGE